MEGTITTPPQSMAQKPYTAPLARMWPCGHTCLLRRLGRGLASVWGSANEGRGEGGLEAPGAWGRGESCG